MADGVLTALIDFGTSGVGDPACDTTIAWTLLSGESRKAFRDELGVDSGTWARGRGWALCKSLKTLDSPYQSKAMEARHTFDTLIAEYLGDR